MLFSNEALEFLYINRLNDSREWYNEHKPEYRRLIIEPMTRLIDELTPTVLSIDPELDCTPKIGRCISRLYRDTRFSKDKSLYRDVVWCTFSRRGDALPCFFFEFSPRCVRWGMGYYCTPRPVMEQLRLMAAGNHPLYTAAMNSVRSSSRLVLTGEKYKRPHFPLQPAEKQDFMDRRDVCFICTLPVSALALPDIISLICEDFIALAPAYKLFTAADSAAHKPDNGGAN